MAEKIEIPDLSDPFLMELQFCGRLKTTDSRILSQLQKLQKHQFAVFSRKAHTFVELFGGGEVKGHLHVNLLIRPTEWEGETKFVPLDKIHSSLEKFAGLKIDVITRGEFLLKLSDIPKESFIRQSKRRLTIGGVQAIRQGEWIAFKKGRPISRLKWRDFSEDFIVITLDAQSLMDVDSTYLLRNKASIVRAFRGLILNDRDYVFNSR